MENENKPKLDIVQELIDKNEISSEVLAAQIVAYRALGMDKDVSILAMQELAKRRVNGDPFKFEEFIETEVAKVPKIPALDFRKLTGDLSLQTLSAMIRKKQ